MAKSLAAFLLVASAFLVGCQHEQAVQDPPPRVLAPPRAVAQQPRPAIAKAAPVATTPTKRSTPAGVPAEWVPTAQANAWRWIVIHHSATPTGSAAAFDREHRAKGWDELGYHFVIGNGTLSKDGQVEVGSRWPKQKWGAHAKTASQEYNNFGIGICLVGNFDLERPTAAEMRSAAKLVAYLMKTYRIPANHVIGHGDTKPTDCPGRNMSVAEVRRLATQLASEGTPDMPPTAGAFELLTDPVPNH